jgi:hypothetical protein
MKFLFILVLLAACSAPPIDPSIPEQNNHLRIEMELNGVTSIGMHEISFSSRDEIANLELKFPPVYKGTLEMWSDRCGRILPTSYNKNEILAIKVVDLLPSDYNTRCTYKIKRRIVDGDNPMLGYFGINFFHKYTPLTVEIDGKKFSGAAHMQVRETETIPVDDYETIPPTTSTMLSINETKIIKVFPRSIKGQILIQGGNAMGVPIDYDFTDVEKEEDRYKILDLATIFSKLTVADSADYEINATAYGTQKMENMMLMLNVYKRETYWLASPILSRDGLDRLVVTFIDPYVAGVSIDSTICENKGVCAAKCKKDQVCVIRAVTRSGRFFYGREINEKFIEVK